MRNRMKVLVSIVLVVFVVLPVSAFAGEASISWGAWGRAVFVPVISNRDGEIVPVDTASWGWNSRIGFTIRGNSDKVGFQADINADTGNVGTQDQHKIWVKLTDALTLEVGPNIFYDTIRGNSTFGAWDWLRYDGITGEDNIFFRGRAGRNGGGVGNSTGGALLHYDANGLHAYASVMTVEDTARENYTTAKMFQRGQYGFGYEIENLGLVRAQYIGKAWDKDPSSEDLESYGVINAAVKIDQAIENLYLDMGAFVPTDTDAENVTIAAYARYKLSDKMTSHLLVDVELDKVDAAGEEDMGLKGAIGIDYDLGNDLTFNGDVRYFNETAVATAGVDSAISFCVAVKKGLGNGVVGIGVEGTSHNFAGGNNIVKENIDDFAFAVPIRLEYWF